MATAKQYELFFMLKAQLDSAFTSGFSTARNYMTQLQSKVREYRQALRDISAYQKHEQALNTLIQKQREEQQALDTVKQKIAANGSETKALTAEKERHERALIAVNQKIEDQKAKLEADRQALEQSKISTDNLVQSEEDLKNKLEETTQEMQEWADFQNRVNDLANAFSAMKIVADGALGAVKAIIGGVRDCMDAAAELQYTMSSVQAVSGATAEETSQLTALAKEMGATTVYTASQCAEALQTEALAGWSVNEMLSGLPAVVKLAAASGEDLTQMTSIVSDALNAFGLSGEAAVTRFADVLATAATNSNTTVSMLGESLKYVESTAANLGYSIEDVAVALAQMANNALKGSESGTALATALTRMSGANEVAAAEMDKLGLSMYNAADHSAKPLSQFLGELRTTFQDFGDDAQAAQNAASNLAGQRGMRGLLSVVNASDEEWNQLTEAINDCEGAASSMANVRLDNYQGQIYLLESAWDALKTTIGEKFLPIGTEAAGLLTSLADGANTLVSNTGGLVVTLTAGATAFGGVALAVGTASTALGIFRYILQVTSVELSAIALKAGAIGAVAAGIGMLAAFLMQYREKVISADTELKQLKEDTDALTESSNAAIESYNETTKQYEEQREKAEALIDVLENLQEEDQDNLLVQKEIAETVKQLNDLFPDLNLQYDAIKGTLSSTTDEAREFVNTIGSDEIEDTYARLVELRAQQAELEQKIAEERQAAKEAGESSTFSMGAGGMVTAGSARSMEMDNELQTLIQQYNDTSDAIKRAEKSLGDFEAQQAAAAEAAGLLPAQMDELTYAAENYAAAWTTAYDSVSASMDKQYGLMKDIEDLQAISTQDIQANLDEQLQRWTQYTEDLQALMDSGIDMSGFWSQITDGSTQSMSLARAMAQDFKDNGKKDAETISAKYAELESTVQRAKETATNGTAEVQAALKGWADAIKIDDSLKNAGVEVGKGAVQGIVEGLKDDSAAKTQSTSTINAMIEQMKSAAEINSPSKKTIPIGEGLDEGLIKGMSDKEKDVIEQVKKTTEKIIKAFGDNLKSSTFKTYGKDAIQGAIDGINSKRDALVAAARAAAQAASEAYREAQDINSPSKVFEYFGEMDMVGAAQGIEQNQDRASDAFAQAAQDNTAAYLNAKIQEEQALQKLAAANNSGDIITVFDPRLMNLLNRTERPASPFPAVISSSASREKGMVVQLQYSPKIEIKGNSDVSASEIKQKLQEHDGELREMIEEIITEREDSNRRRAY